MVNGKKVIVIMPAYNAEKTLKATFEDIPFDIVDDVVLTDDNSNDNTFSLAKGLGIKHVLKHPENRGYGGNQKTCYDKAIELQADIVVMLHPDYQYEPKLIPSMVNMIAHDLYDVVLGSRILSKGALNGGMPIYKYIANRLLTLTQNILMFQKLSEYHTGYRCFSMDVLKKIPYQNNSDDFVFDNQILAQLCFAKAKIGEVSCPTKYFEDASSINLAGSSKYGLGVLWVSISYFLQKIGLFKFNLFKGI